MRSRPSEIPIDYHYRNENTNGVHDKCEKEIFRNER
jgi:hypothetical protein